MNHRIIGIAWQPSIGVELSKLSLLDNPEAILSIYGKKGLLLQMPLYQLSLLSIGITSIGSASDSLNLEDVERIVYPNWVGAIYLQLQDGSFAYDLRVS